MLIDIYCSGPAFTNTIVIACEKTRQAAIIDAALSSSDHVAQFIERMALTPIMLLLTHSHWDHFADAAKMIRRWNLPLFVHPEDAPNLEKPGADGLPCLIEITPVKPDQELHDGQILQIGDIEIEVLHTPGHSPGGVGFYVPKEHLLISGDTLFKGSIGKVSFPQSDPEKMWASLKRLASLPPETRVIPGHGEETTIGNENWLKEAKHYFGELI